jgi:hypothetical protein
MKKFLISFNEHHYYLVMNTGYPYITRRDSSGIEFGRANIDEINIRQHISNSNQIWKEYDKALEIAQKYLILK